MTAPGAGARPPTGTSATGHGPAHETFAGRVALVAGGGSGLGAAIARRVASEAAFTIVADIDNARAENVSRAIAESHGDAEPVTLDVTSEGEVAALIDAIAEQHGRLDVMVYSAAVELRASVLDTSDDQWRSVIDVNLKGAFLCLKHGLPLMEASGGGAALLLGSTLGTIASPGYAAYCASKGALTNLAKQAAIEHAAAGVRVNILSPSACESGLFLETAARAPDPDAVKSFVAARTPLGRLGTERDVTDAAMFLLSDASAYLSGAIVPLDGGLAARRS